MRATLHRHPHASSRRDVAAWGFWLARWSLVLLLMADLLGAPLHHHHHDGGIDGAWPTASVDHAADHAANDAAHDAADRASHVEDADHDDAFSHSTLVVPASGEAVKVSAVADDVIVFLQVATALAMLAPAAEDEAGRRPPPAWRSPFINAHRSLPPAGRAPPSHA